MTELTIVDQLALFDPYAAAGVGLGTLARA